jgi:uncharacterized protein
MPLLLCPNDNGSMQTVQRSGVEFDICPTCRGVWLDRGELEKLLTTARQDLAGDPPPPPAQPSGFLPPQVQRHHDRSDRDDCDDDYRKDHYKKRAIRSTMPPGFNDACTPSGTATASASTANPLGIANGCAFAPRCPKVFEQCIASEPALSTKGPHKTRCHLV